MLKFEKQETKGRADMIALFDAGTFVELGAYVRRRGDNQPYDAVITGYGSVNGKLAFAFVQDSDRKAGALDDTGAEKIEKLYEQALRVGAPVIGVFDSAGAVVYDGAAALNAYGRVMTCVSRASGIIPQIAYVSGTCTGMAETIAAMFDVTVAVSEKTSVKTAVAAKDDATAVSAVRALIELLPRNNKDVSAVDPTDDVARPVSMADGVVTLADGGVLTELYADIATEVKTALTRMGGETVGLVALNGKLTALGARKASRLVSFCDSFSIPVVTTVDSEGVAAEADASIAYGKLAKAYITATTAKVTVVTGKAYGAAFTLMGSRALGADLALALETSVISVLAPETAVAFAMNDLITAEKSRADVEAQWIETYASPVAAAEAGAIDDVIPEAELRARVISALYMLAEKADGTPDRKHGVPTL